MKDEKKLNETMRRKAVDHGLCAQWQREWKEDWNLDTMADKFYQGIDFFLKERFISEQDLQENFAKEWLRKKNIIVNDKYSLLNPKQAILIGHSSSNIRYNGFNCATIYIIDDSEANVTLKERSFALIHVLGKAKVNVKAYGGATCTVLRHSTDATVTADNSVKVKDELDYLRS